MRSQRGGVALIMLLGFIVLAVPAAVSALETAQVLSRASLVYDKRLTGMYNAGAGVEVAMHEILSDPTFDDDLATGDPSKDLIVDINGDSVTVTVTKIFSAGTLQGQGIIVEKSVMPTSTSQMATTTFTYDLKIRNGGTGTVEIVDIYDYLPPGFTYVAGSTAGLASIEPTINQNGPMTCGSSPYELRWNLTPENITVSDGEELTLQFQAKATLSDGTYYNQAMVRYDPWWTGPDAYIYTPYAAEVTAGTASAQKCGYDLDILVTQSVDPEQPVPGVEQDFTYTLTVENVSTSDRYVCKIEDLLPPTFSYINPSASSAEFSDNIWPHEPIEEWQRQTERWNLRWADGSDESLQPLMTLSGGTSGTQRFKARAIPQSGADYFNEFDVVWARSLVGGKCKNSDGGAVYGGTGEGSEVHPPTLYDVLAVGPDGTVQSRMIFYEANGELEIMSWQEY